MDCSISDADPSVDSGDDLPGFGVRAAPVIEGSYYEENRSITCPADPLGCLVVFGGIPVDKALTVTGVSCSAKFDSADAITQTRLVQKRRRALIRSHFLEYAIFVSGSQKYLTTNSAVRMRFGGGSVPAIFFDGQDLSNGIAECKIIGDFQ